MGPGVLRGREETFFFEGGPEGESKRRRARERELRGVCIRLDRRRLCTNFKRSYDVYARFVSRLEARVFVAPDLHAFPRRLQHAPVRSVAFPEPRRRRAPRRSAAARSLRRHDGGSRGSGGSGGSGGAVVALAAARLSRDELGPTGVDRAPEVDEVLRGRERERVRRAVPSGAAGEESAASPGVPHARPRAPRDVRRDDDEVGTAASSETRVVGAWSTNRPVVCAGGSERRQTRIRGFSDAASPSLPTRHHATVSRWYSIRARRNATALAGDERGRRGAGSSNSRRAVPRSGSSASVGPRAFGWRTADAVVVNAPTCAPSSANERAPPPGIAPRAAGERAPRASASNGREWEPSDKARNCC